MSSGQNDAVVSPPEDFKEFIRGVSTINVSRMLHVARPVRHHFIEIFEVVETLLVL